MSLPSLAADRMAEHLTQPFARGADRLPLRFVTGASATVAVFADYDFAEHIARFEAGPEPRYVLRALADIAADTTITVSYAVRPPGGSARNGSATVVVPAGTLAGMSVLLPLGADDGVFTRLRDLTVNPGTGNASQDWAVTALLGNLAKLLWVLGAERDVVAAHERRIRTATRLPFASGLTMDLIGYDLGVPRFPPLPYGFEAGTVALYHFDDPARVADSAELYGGVGHPGTLSGATLGAAGRFGSGCAFGTSAARVTVNDHADFVVAASDRITVEGFVKPDGQGTFLSKMDTKGWSISFGDLGRGFTRDIGAVLTDGTATVRLFGDQNLDTSRFHHVALVVDGPARQARLYLDGVVVAVAGLGSLGALTSPAQLVFGGFTGVVDEVRFSRDARTRFHPVLGEADDSYRRRLRIFQRWTLPTPQNLQRALNDGAGMVQGVADPFVVDDTNSVLAGGGHPVTVLPTGIPPGGTIDDLGRRHSPEFEVCATIADDDAFEPALLADGGDTRADFTAGRKMRVGTRRALRALLDLVPGRLRVVSAYEPGAPDLRAVGRAVLLSHSTLKPEKLAVFAYQAGFSWINHRPGGLVYASVRSKDTVEIVPSGSLLEQQTITVQVDPPLPLGTRCAWSVVLTGAGRVELTTTPDSPTATVKALHTGDFTLDVQINKGARAFSANQILRIGLDSLPASDSIAADGTRGVAETVAGKPDDAFFDPAYLANVGGQRLHPAVASLFSALATAVTGTLKLTSGWSPGGTGLETVGRALTVEPGTSPVTVGRLAAIAHDVGFAYVRNNGTSVRLAAEASDPLVITGPDTVTEDGSVHLSVTTKALPAAGVFAGNMVCVANSGTDTVSFIGPDGKIPRVTKIGLAPAAITASPDGKTVFAVDTGVTAVTVATGQVAGAAVITGKPVAIVHNPASPALYVASQATDQLTVVNSGTLAVTAVRGIPRQPVAIAADPGGANVWVACAGDKVVQSMATATNTVSTPIDLPGPAAGIAVTANLAYVTVSEPPQLVVINTSTRAVVGTFTDIGPTPGAVAVTPDGSKMFVADTKEGAIYPRKPDGSAAAAAVRTGHTPVGLVARDDRLYVNNQAVQGGADNVGVVDLAHPRVLATVWPLGTGHGERLSWTVRAAAEAAGRVSSSTAPDVELVGQRSGPVLVEAFYAWQDKRQPYTVQIRFNPELEALERAGTPVVLRKDQYDLVMNVLNELHPIGVEIDTGVVRAHVLELRAGLQDVYPGYTYPGFRFGRLKPPVTRKENTT
jgi:DNA-binding beta-propeller fold protein YncE